MNQVKVEFTGKNLTGQAGFVHMERFIRKLGLHSLLERHITIERGDNARYSVADVVTMLAMGALAGAKHMCQMAVLRTDQVIRQLFDWEAFPDDRTFGRIFELFTPAHCYELASAEAEARKKVGGKRWFGRITLDMDSTVKSVHGVRADSAFFDGALLDYLEWYGCQYLIKVKLKNLVELLMAKEWRKNQSAAGSIFTKDFWANSALFQTCILAYNLMVWMTWLTTGSA